jgi:hypothetical protein
MNYFYDFYEENLCFNDQLFIYVYCSLVKWLIYDVKGRLKFYEC